MARLQQVYKDEVAPALKQQFGYTPRYTSREAFTAWREAQGL